MSDEQIAYYLAWKAHWAAPRPLRDEHDPYRCPTCNRKMERHPWRCPEHGECSPAYVEWPYSANLSRHVDKEAAEWPDPEWEPLVDGLLSRLKVQEGQPQEKQAGC